MVERIKEVLITLTATLILVIFSASSMDSPFTISVRADDEATALAHPKEKTTTAKTMTRKPLEDLYAQKEPNGHQRYD